MNIRRSKRIVHGSGKFFAPAPTDLEHFGEGCLLLTLDMLVFATVAGSVNALIKIIQTNSFRMIHTNLIERTKVRIGYDNGFGLSAKQWIPKVSTPRDHSAQQARIPLHRAFTVPANIHLEARSLPATRSIYILT